MKKKAGQSTLEFILVSVLFFSFTFFHFKLSVLLAFGNYVHYATFMAARALLSGGSSEAEQMDSARTVITKMLKGQGGDRFKAIAKEDGPGIQVGSSSRLNRQERSLTWLYGVRYSFKGKLFMISPGKAGSLKDQDNQLSLVSESWLGREVSDEECTTYIQTQSAAFELDNGC
jgi:hypothetical protein